MVLIASWSLERPTDTEIRVLGTEIGGLNSRQVLLLSDLNTEILLYLYVTMWKVYLQDWRAL